MSIGSLLDDVPAAMAAAIDSAGITLDGTALSVSDTDVKVLNPPHVTISGPSAIERREPDEPESQLGSRDLRLLYVLRLVVPLVGSQGEVEAQRAVRLILGQIIDALDADPTAGGTVNLEAQFVNGDMSFSTDDNEKQIVVYECDVVALCLVA